MQGPYHKFERAIGLGCSVYSDLYVELRWWRRDKLFRRAARHLFTTASSHHNSKHKTTIHIVVVDIIISCFQQMFLHSIFSYPKVNIIHLVIVELCDPAVLTTSSRSSITTPSGHHQRRCHQPHCAGVISKTATSFQLLHSKIPEWKLRIDLHAHLQPSLTLDLILLLDLQPTTCLQTTPTGTKTVPVTSHLPYPD